MNVSILEFLGFDKKEESNAELLKGLKEHTSKCFPGILLLMNINGSICHRTSDMIHFKECKDEDGENPAPFQKK